MKNSKIMIFLSILLILQGFAVTAWTAIEPKDKQAEKETDLPVITGYGKGLFVAGDLLFRDDFQHLNNWHIQIQETDHESNPEIRVSEGKLDVFMPARGATIWFKHKIEGPVTILYDVVAPTNRTEHPWVVPRDINTFWHASDLNDPADIFNDDRYTGAFSTYHKQVGYYASTGGRDNTTTRFRRYPRMKNGEPVDHISLSDKDGLEEYLIRPDQTHTIQLTVYEDVVQYIIDGNLVYEIREGDEILIEDADGNEKQAVYSTDQFPPYNEGWFGFRMVRTHHVYSNFRVYRLEPH